VNKLRQKYFGQEFKKGFPLPSGWSGVIFEERDNLD